MAHVAVKNLSEMRGAFRLDAEFWLPEYERVENAITSIDHVSLGDLAADVRKGIFYILASEYTERGVPFYRSSNVGQILMKETNLAYISEEKDTKEAKTSLRCGDIVLGKTGKEAAAIVTVERCNISQDVIGIRLTDGAINPFFLAAFLNSEAGILQMRRWFQGQVQMHLTLPDCRRILVPILTHALQQTVEGTVREAFKRRADSQGLYASAEGLLLSELGLGELDLSPTLFYQRSYSEACAAARLDAEFFRPKYCALIDAIRRTGRGQLLGDIVTHCERGLQPKYDDEGDVPVVNTKHMGTQFLSDDYERCSHEAWSKQKKAQLKQYDALFYSTGAYIGRTNCWFGHGKAIGSNHVTIIRPKAECNPVYLSLFMNSEAGRMQADRLAHGSAQREVYPSDIREFTLWLPPMKKQDRLAEMILQAKSARDESRRLLDDAKRMVEEAVLGLKPA